jgi:hypothetical protein
MWIHNGWCWAILCYMILGGCATMCEGCGGTKDEPDPPVIGPLDFPSLYSLDLDAGAETEADAPRDIVATTGLCMTDNIVSQIECFSYTCEAGTCYAWDELDGSNLRRCEAQEDCLKGETCGFCVSLEKWRGE